MILRNGLLLRGNTWATGSVGGGRQGANVIRIVDSRIRRAYFHRRQIVEENNNYDTTQLETFELRHRKSGARPTPVGISGYLHTTGFDETGCRFVTLRDRGQTIQVKQGARLITPKMVLLDSLTHQWQLGISTKTIPPDQLQRLVHLAIDEDNIQDRRSACLYFKDAGLFPLAMQELKQLRNDFPEQDDQWERLAVLLDQEMARLLLDELQARLNAGQFELAARAAHQLPLERLEARATRRVREVLQQYEQTGEQIFDLRLTLGELESQLEDASQRSTVATLRGILSDEVDRSGLDRLRTHLELLHDSPAPADEQLAAIFSAWLLGDEHSLSDLGDAIRLWDARHLVREFVLADSEDRRNELSAALREIEGLTPARLARMIRHLPPVLDDVPVRPGVPVRIPVGESAYHVLLPPEYSRNAEYPLIVALRPYGVTEKDVIELWGGNQLKPGLAARQGYIVIAPETLPPEQEEYHDDGLADEIVLDCLRDARLRFRVDSDRVFLTGHGLGADAAYNIGMAHADQFAGVIPICGVPTGTIKVVLEER